LSQHLDNEFSNPSLTAQIDQVGVAAFWVRFLKKESPEKVLDEAVREKLVEVSERGTFAGTCKICQSYFDNEGKK